MRNIGSEVDVVVMGERIKRTTGPATATVNRDAGTTHPDDEATDAVRDAGGAADGAGAGAAAHRGATGAGGS